MLPTLLVDLGPTGASHGILTTFIVGPGSCLDWATESVALTNPSELLLIITGFYTPQKNGLEESVDFGPVKPASVLGKINTVLVTPALTESKDVS